MKISHLKTRASFFMGLTLLATFTILPKAAHAVIVAQYNFTGSTLNSSHSSPISTASTFGTEGFTSVINTSIGDPAPSIFAQADLTNSPGVDPNFIPAPSASDYFHFTVTPVATTLDYTTLTMDVRTMTNHSAIFYFSVQTSLDNFATNITTYSITGSDSTMAFQSYSFDLSAFAPSSDAEEFRIVIRDNTSSASRGLVFDNVALNAVPEPTTATLLLGTLAAGALIRRRRSKHSGRGPLI